MDIKEQIKNIVKKNNNNESCGLIVNDALVFDCKNISTSPKNHFVINPKDYLKASLSGKITGCYHTHTDKTSNFSFFDIINAHQNKLKYYMYYVPQDSFHELNIQNMFPFINKPFEYGKNDCYTLIKDYYKNLLNISLPEFGCYDNLLNKWSDQVEFKKDYEKYGFRLLANNEENNKHDVFLFNFHRATFSPHFAIFLGNNYILHHPRNGFSQIIFITDVYLNKLIMKWRHSEIISNE